MSSVIAKEQLRILNYTSEENIKITKTDRIKVLSQQILIKSFCFEIRETDAQHEKTEENINTEERTSPLT